MTNFLDYYGIVLDGQNSQLISVAVPLSKIGAGTGLTQITLFEEILFTGIKKLFIINMSIQFRVQDNVTGILIPYQKSSCIAKVQFPSHLWPNINAGTNHGQNQGFTLNEGVDNTIMFGVEELSGNVGIVIDSGVFFSAIVAPNVDINATVGITGIAYRM